MYRLNIYSLFRLKIQISYYIKYKLSNVSETNNK